MGAAAPSQPQALGTVPDGDVRQCMFCSQPIANRHAAFIDHVRDKVACREAYQAWLERLDEDRLGG